MTQETNVPTKYPLVSVTLNYDSTRILTVTKENDSRYYIKQYDIDTYDLLFEEAFGDNDTSYIKLKDIE